MNTETILNDLHELTTVIAGIESLLKKTLQKLSDKYGTETFLNYVSIHGYFQGYKRLLNDYIRLNEAKEIRNNITKLYMSLIEK
jgi:hypothetical protein